MDTEVFQESLKTFEGFEFLLHLPLGGVTHEPESVLNWDKGRILEKVEFASVFSVFREDCTFQHADRNHG